MISSERDQRDHACTTWSIVRADPVLAPARRALTECAPGARCVERRSCRRPPCRPGRCARRRRHRAHVAGSRGRRAATSKRAMHVDQQRQHEQHEAGGEQGGAVQALSPRRTRSRSPPRGCSPAEEVVAELRGVADQDRRRRSSRRSRGRGRASRRRRCPSGEYGRTAMRIISQRVAPSASAASLWSDGHGAPSPRG